MESNKAKREELGGQMSFLAHLDEFRKRLVRSVIVVILATMMCWFVSAEIYAFLSAPVTYALSEAERREVNVEGLTGREKILPLSQLKENDTGRYVFDRATKLGNTVVSPGTSVLARVLKNREGRLEVFTDEPIFTSNAIIPEGISLPVEFNRTEIETRSAEERMVVKAVTEPFTLKFTVALYAAIAFSIPFLLLQVWGFISPALYKHERAYVTPFIGLSSISFVIGAAFAYYILLPPALKYLLGLGEEFRLFLSASDYLDFVLFITLAMGVVFQMPAISYVLARIGLISAGFLLKSWKIAIVVILIVAAVASPTPDVVNMMLFAAPMMLLYMISIFVAWFFGRKRKNNAEIGDALE